MTLSGHLTWPRAAQMAVLGVLGALNYMRAFTRNYYLRRIKHIAWINVRNSSTKD
jgi:hypothetical protein